MKAILLVITAVSAMAGASSHAFAQQWDPWDGPRRPPVQVFPGDDDPYADPRDDRYSTNRYFDNREGPRVDNRSDYRDDDPRRYDPRYNGGPDYGDDDDRVGPRYRDARPIDRGYVNAPRDNYPRYGARDDYGAWDAAPSADDEARLSKTPGTNGGDKPNIRPVAPPQVAFSGPYAPGSIVIDTSARKLYYVLSSTSAYAYSIGVGRQGFTWTGKEKVSRIADWPDWYPPADMRQRKPELPVRMLGGIRNPLGAKAIYLGNTLYRIHGTNDPKSIGKAESSGCFRMLNENVLHLATLVRPGTEVTVVRSLGNKIASNAKSSTSRARTEKTTSPPRTVARDAVPRDDDDYDPYNGWH
ncbi:L,D-transpeptidase [Hyphomicrobium sp. 99]|uniref:L,D-transpeptidase n=1 Tax=Hyphomicrobium sp. 99 TaxID=1163419 RepID=UPI0005F86C65|nr:L,D-transpeptidase [Hyphomicrobium sp. 99]